MTSILSITDGTTEVSLIAKRAGFHLKEWRPGVPQLKGGGVYQNSPVAPSQRLAFGVFDIVEETFNLVVNDEKQDSLIKQAQDLLRLLEKARNYSLSKAQTTPVYLKAQSTCETNIRYALIKNYQIRDLDNPYAQPFMSVGDLIAMRDIILIVQRADWLANPPGTGESIEASFLEAYDGRTLGRNATTAREVYVTSKHNVANLTDVYVNDGGVFSANLMDAALPFDLLPAVPAVGDIIYFGIDTSVTDSGPFSNIVLDIGTAQTDITSVAYEYYNGGWTAINVTDNTTTTTTTPLFGEVTGVNSIHWVQPNDWTAYDLSGAGGPAITAFWFRIRVTGIGGAPTAPTQQNRLIYSSINGYIDIDDLQIGGDIPSLARAIIQNESDKDASGPFSPALAANRVLVGLRKTSRGSNFRAFINLSDEQNPAGITVATGFASTAFATDTALPTGRKIRCTPPGASGMTTRATITLDDTISNEYLGTYHAYMRLKAGSANVFKVRIQSNQGGVVTTGDSYLIPATTDFFVVDLKDIVIGNDDIATQEILNTLVFNIQASSTGAGTLDFYDLILMPTDEQAADFMGDSTRYIGKIFTGGATFDSLYLDADSITIPKTTIRGVVKYESTDYIQYRFLPLSSGELIYQPNVDQRLWLFNMEASGNYWVGKPEVSNSLQLFKNERFLSLRGDR